MDNEEIRDLVGQLSPILEHEAIGIIVAAAIQAKALGRVASALEDIASAYRYK